MGQRETEKERQGQSRRQIDRQRDRQLLPAGYLASRARSAARNTVLIQLEGWGHCKPPPTEGSSPRKTLSFETCSLPKTHFIRFHQIISLDIKSVTLLMIQLC